MGSGVGHPWGIDISAGVRRRPGPTSRPGPAQTPPEACKFCWHLTLCRELDICPLLLAVLEAPLPSTPQPVDTTLAMPLHAGAGSILTLMHVFARTHPLCGYPWFSRERVTMTWGAWPEGSGRGARLLPPTSCPAAHAPQAVGPAPTQPVPSVFISVVKKFCFISAASRDCEDPSFFQGLPILQQPGPLTRAPYPCLRPLTLQVGVPTSFAQFLPIDVQPTPCPWRLSGRINEGRC